MFSFQHDRNLFSFLVSVSDCSCFVRRHRVSISVRFVAAVVAAFPCDSPCFAPPIRTKTGFIPGARGTPPPKKHKKPDLFPHTRKEAPVFRHMDRAPQPSGRKENYLLQGANRSVCLSVCLSVCQGIIHDLHPPCQAYFPNFFARFCFHYDIIVNNASVNIIPKFDRNFN